MIKNKRILVVGKGRTGKAVFEKVKELGGIAEYYEYYKNLSNKYYDIAVISPGISRKTDTYYNLKGSGIPIYSELDFAYMLEPFKAISVSGTNGKTTVVNLVCGMLNTAGVNASLLGNVGVPFSNRQRSDWYVCELSSFMLEQSRFFRSEYSSITNIAPDHKEYHTTFEKYQNAKFRLFKYTEKGIVYNDKRINGSLIPYNLKRLKYSLYDSSADFFIQDNRIKYAEKGKIFDVFPLVKVKLFGEHNLENILNSLALCTISNGFKTEYSSFLEEYKGEKYRLEYKGIVNGKNVFNDSKGTNVASVISAYKCMKGSTALILGGFDKGESYRSLFEKLKKEDRVFISGDNASKIAEEAGKRNVIHKKTQTLEEAIVKATRSNCDNVLFSPGCSSFDRFANFEERGEFFDEFIKKIEL